MELLRISENALKVMLTREDMENYDIAFEALDYKSRETRRALSRILAEAKTRVGFSAESDRLYIQAFSDGEGGCELFVRRREGEERQVYEFACISSLLLACARLYNCGFKGKSMAHRRVGDSMYYLSLDFRGEERYIFLSELASRVSLPDGFLSEHTELLCEDAVKVLGRLR